MVRFMLQVIHCHLGVIHTQTCSQLYEIFTNDTRTSLRNTFLRTYLCIHVHMFKSHARHMVTSPRFTQVTCDHTCEIHTNKTHPPQ
uniref:Uncharacterized protein n=1 Tax=Anguilla anguilla TaxID=7936 RepID=A0A0E9WU54_ANGAN